MRDVNAPSLSDDVQMICRRTLLRTGRGSAGEQGGTPIPLSSFSPKRRQSVRATQVVCCHLVEGWRRGWDSDRAKSLPSTTYGISEALKTPETLKTVRVGTIQE